MRYASLIFFILQPQSLYTYHSPLLKSSVRNWSVYCPSPIVPTKVDESQISELRSYWASLYNSRTLVTDWRWLWLDAHQCRIRLPQFSYHCQHVALLQLQGPRLSSKKMCPSPYLVDISQPSRSVSFFSPILGRHHNPQAFYKKNSESPKMFNICVSNPY